MVEASWAVAAHRFQTWYSQCLSGDLWYPPRLNRRELMFQTWAGNRYDRHIGVSNQIHAHGLFTRLAPKSAFYSTAYYDDPTARKMADKGWRGADLVFDLDGDHLAHVDPFDFPDMMDIIQEQAFSLWNDFLEPEFGFTEQHLHITFSGHRGFHLHYRQPDLLQLDSHARRELVNYIRGLGVEMNLTTKGDALGWHRRLSNGSSEMVNKLRIIDAGGDEGRAMLKQLKAVFEERKKAPDCKVSSLGVEKIKAMAEFVSQGTRGDKIASGIYGALSNKYQAPFIELVRGDTSVILGSARETDEAVTVDTKRQIRWPNSLNGKSGMQVTTFGLERLDPSGSNRYDALVEALPKFEPSNRRLEVCVDRCVIKVGEECLELAMGDVIDADVNTDTFLSLKGWATPI